LKGARREKVNIGQETDRGCPGKEKTPASHSRNKKGRPTLPKEEKKGHQGFSVMKIRQKYEHGKGKGQG